MERTLAPMDHISYSKNSAEGDYIELKILKDGSWTIKGRSLFVFSDWIIDKRGNLDKNEVEKWFEELVELLNIKLQKVNFNEYGVFESEELRKFRHIISQQITIHNKGNFRRIIWPVAMPLTDADASTVVRIIFKYLDKLNIPNEIKEKIGLAKK